MITKNNTFYSMLRNGFTLAILFVFFGLNSTFSQDSTKNEPVGNTFSSGIFLENQTYIMNYPKSWEMVINHRFGKLSDGASEAWGIYSPSNIRFAMNYAINKNLQVGLGTTKFDKQQDGNIKYNFFQQSTNGKIPVSVTYYGEVSFDARDTNSFNYKNHKVAHRFSYFNEIMIARKLCDHFTLQVAPMYTHFNIVESDSVGDAVRKNDNFGISVLGKLNMTQTMSLFIEFDKNLTKILHETSVYKNPKPVFALGIETATAAHSFQVFLTTGESIIYQKNMVYNSNEIYGKGDSDWWWKSGLMLGFNITRLFY